ncbi:ATP-dependent carboxylate-amine ligase [Roseibium denhamense]|uniref:D-ala D-ala ligase C-terminus n=1 Tax=Roseibium denhamense TaxID=76305 RepID=A0ABY1PAJ8_9HYPH|nr:ATP-dependent carboxylate-amine ligase [Roseibium denhamense]MTI07519.1 ATP-dependent carboxylate-amine ligase [Roseibium denhamense]SMP30176.1 D-ala D-ala ligase C-terminus [Roseibium denhamense]
MTAAGQEPAGKGQSEAGKSLVFRLLSDYCRENGLRLSAADPHGHAGSVDHPDGKRWLFKGTRFDINPQGAAEIAADKAYALSFLKAAGLPVPETLFVESKSLRNRQRPPSHILDFADAHEFPIFVKPNEGKEGVGVLKTDTFHGLESALHILAAGHDALIVQEALQGREIRVVVLDGEVLCAYERQPASVTGDGERSCAELIDAHPKVNAADGRIDFTLSQQALTLEAVPEAGRIVQLLPVANLSSGGSAEIIDGNLAPGLAVAARKAAQTLGLRYAGIDLIVPHGSEIHPAIILEVNAAPGFAKLHKQGPGAAELVDAVYKRLFSALFAS